MTKKILVVFALLLSWNFTFGQSILFARAPLENTTTQQRAPNGLANTAYMRACALVLQPELTVLPAGAGISSFGFTLSTNFSMSVPVTGNFTLYLQNTGDVAYLKGTSWPTILTGMTQVYASVITIPQSATTTSVMISLSSPYTYTGGGLYVAYDWQSTGPFTTAALPATYHADGTGLSPGCASAADPGSPPTTLVTTGFRPTFLFEAPNPFNNDVNVIGIEAPGRIASILNTPHTISALVKNSSTATLSNITVSASVAGANAYSNNQLITSLAPGASSMVTFAPFNPMTPGTQTISVAVASDQNNINYVKTYPQVVSCDVWAKNPAVTTFTGTGVGFTNGAGILSTPFLNPVTSTLVGLQAAVSTSTGNPGNNVYGVLMSAVGAIIATTNTINLTSAMQNSIISFSFATPQNLTPATTYYFGFAQTANATVAYFPAANHPVAYLPASLYFSSAITGGVFTPVQSTFGYFGLHGVFAHTVTISAAPVTVNCGTSATLNAVSATNYSWSTSATTSSITVNTPTSNTNFTVTATNTLGCSASAIASLIVNPLPLAISASPTVACSGEQLNLTAAGANSYTWASPTSTAFISLISDTPTTTTTYTLYGSNLNGCDASTMITIPVNPLPIVNVSSSQPSICIGGSVALNASGNAVSYVWSVGPTTNTVAVNPTLTTTYSVIGQSAAGCSKMGTVTIIVDSFTPGITSATTVCQGQQITLNATGASTLQWSTGSIFASITVTPSSTTTYTLTGRGLNGCQGNNAVTIGVDPTPTVSAVSSKTAICKGESAVLTATGATTYSWSTSATNFSTVVTPTANVPYTYSVTGTNNAGCTATAQVILKVDQCTGIVEAERSDLISVFPNPTSGKVTVAVTGDISSSNILITNILGELIVSEPLTAEKRTYDLSGLPDGLYFVSVLRDGFAVRTTRIIKN